MNSILSAGAVALLIFGCLEYISWKAKKETESKVANALLNKQIEDRDKAIEAAKTEQKESADAYYAARAKFNAEYHPGVDVLPPKPKG